VSFEEVAASIVRKFGVDKPENTFGYMLILSALQDAYAKGQAASEQVNEVCNCQSKQIAIESGLVKCLNCGKPLSR
jgi:hypothetical protein